jgi:hypothetical protein
MAKSEIGTLHLVIAGLDLESQHQAQSGDDVGIVASVSVRGTTTWLVLVVATHRPLLLTVRRHDGDIGIKKPGLTVQWRGHDQQTAVTTRPRRTGPVCRALHYPRIGQAADFPALGEERQLPERRDRAEGFHSM